MGRKFRGGAFVGVNPQIEVNPEEEKLYTQLRVLNEKYEEKSNELDKIKEHPENYPKGSTRKNSYNSRIRKINQYITKYKEEMNEINRRLAEIREGYVGGRRRNKTKRARRK